MVLRSFIPPLFLVFLVLGSIVFGWATPTEAAGVGAGGAVFLALLNRKLNFGVLEGRCRALGFDRRYDLRDFSGRDLLFLCLSGAQLGDATICVVSLVDEPRPRVVGTSHNAPDGADLLPGIFLRLDRNHADRLAGVSRRSSPALEFGDHVDKFEVVYWFAILLAVNLQTSFLTPPFGFALFYMKGVAPPEVKIQDIYRGIIPFVMIQLIGLGLVMGFPDLALWLPRVMLN